MKQTLIIFVKNAVKGKVKTRLAATVGDDVAFTIYKNLLSHTESCTRFLTTDKIVFYSDYTEVEDVWGQEIYQKKTQKGSNLGERMQHAFEYAFANGSESVAIIGSDCFEINAPLIEDAFAKLQCNDVILGPALDGGYYLLAMKAYAKPLFRNIEWSTNKVLNQTLDLCHELGLKTTLIQELSDIDNEDDLKRMGYSY